MGAIYTAEAALAIARQQLAAAQAANPQVPATITAAQTAVATAQQNLTDNITNAELQLVAAKKQLADALSVTPQVPGDIATAQAAVTTATDAIATAKKTSNGAALTKATDFTPPNGETDKKGLYALEDADLFNLYASPHIFRAETSSRAWFLMPLRIAKRRAMLLVDPQAGWHDTASAKAGVGSIGTNSKNSALFFPRLTQPNPLHDDQLEDFVPCGALAGIFARTDSTRGVWKAPAGLDATLVGVPALSVLLTDAENGELNPVGINCLRRLPIGGRSSGARAP